MSIIALYLELLKYPDSIKVYRNIEEYYKQVGMKVESEAFSHLISKKFNGISKLYVDDTFANEKQ